MKGKFFIDTNILVYSFDPVSPRKQIKAQELIAKAMDTAGGILSFQVIQEFINVALQKFKPPFRSDDCFEFVRIFLYPLCEVFPSLDLYREALRIKTRYGYSFYDSLIVSAALQADCRILYSEDLHPGQVIDGLRIVNPFS